MFEKLWNQFRRPRSDAGPSKTERQLEELNERVREFQRKGQYEYALGAAVEVGKLVEKYFGAEHPDFVWSLKDQAFFEQQLGDYRAAESHYQAAYDAAQSLFGAQDVETGRILHAQGKLYRAAGDHQRAASCFEEGLGILRSTG
jgi:tetratricopeptide (TPR) repeat protein